MFSRLFFVPMFSFLSSLFLYLPTFLPPSVASLGILSGSSLSLLLPPFPLFPLSPLFLPHLSSPSTPAFPLRFPFPPPLLSLKVFAQSGLAQRGSTSCRSHPKWLPAAMSDASCCESPAKQPNLSWKCALGTVKMAHCNASQILGLIGARGRWAKGRLCIITSVPAQELSFKWGCMRFFVAGAAL